MNGRPLTVLRLAALVGLLLGAGCGEPEAGCDTLTPSVSIQNSDPLFTWEPNCAVAALFVSPPDNDQAYVWSAVAKPGENNIRAPVTYGVGPEGTALMTPPDSLTSGALYRLRLMRTTGPAGFGWAPVGSVTFTAP